MIKSNVVIDIAEYQPNPLDLDAIKAEGIEAIVHKTTRGLSKVDPTVERIPEIEAAGFLIGLYHFGTTGSGKLQALHFLSTVKNIVKPVGKYLPVLDWEDSKHGIMSVKDAEEFVQAIYDDMGIWPGIYSRDNIIDPLMGKKTDTILSNCWYWESQYNDKPLSIPKIFGNVWTLHQYTDKGQINGIDANVDRNYFNGTTEDLHQFWGRASAAKGVDNLHTGDAGKSTKV